jgi:putative acetyltransferase
MALTIRTISVDEPDVLALLRIHLEGMHASSPPGSVFALDTSGLQQPDVTFWGAFDTNTLLGFGALKELAHDTGEIKSMRTHPAHLRKGFAAALLAHILETARTRTYRRLSLETGSGSAFEPALALYRRAGFANGDAFGDYVASEFNQFLHLAL